MLGHAIRGSDVRPNRVQQEKKTEANWNFHHVSLLKITASACCLSALAMAVGYVAESPLMMFGGFAGVHLSLNALALVLEVEERAAIEELRERHL